MFVEQERGDQESGQDEEHVDAEESASDAGKVCVVGDDRDDRDRAQPVETG
jgi:hypothetical protein